MPYIDKSLRIEIDEKMQELLRMNLDVGELNYVITQLLLEYVNNNNTRYSTCNAIVGVLECCKLEFYRRLVAPYEEKKTQENGDVYKK